MVEPAEHRGPPTPRRTRPLRMAALFVGLAACSAVGRRPRGGREALPGRPLRRGGQAGGRGDRRRVVARALAPPQDPGRAGAGASTPRRWPRSRTALRARPRERVAPPARPRRLPFNGRDDDAAAEMDAIESLILVAPQRYATPEGRVALGRFFLLRGPTPEGARPVLRRRHQGAARPRRRLPRHRRAGPRQAGRRPRGRDPPKAPKAAAEDPRFHYLLARAFSDDDRARSDKELAEALKINPQPRRQPAAPGRPPDRRRAVRRGRARCSSRSLEVNPHEPRAWAYRAVLAHLRNDPDGRGRGADVGPGALGDEPRGRPPDRPQALAEVPLRRGVGLPAAGARARPRLPARQDPALPGPAPARRRGRGLEARRRDLRQRRLQRRRLQPDHPPRPPRRVPHARGRRLPRPDGPARGRPLRPPRRSPCCGGRRKTLGEKYGVDARRAR